MVNILNLPRWNVTAVKENAHDYRVEATIPEEAPGYCGKCGAMFAKVYKHGSREQLIHDQIVTNRGSKLPVPECLRVAFRSIPWSETAVLLPSQMATYGDKWDEGLRVVIECAQRLPGGDSLSKGFATRLTALRERQTA